MSILERLVGITFILLVISSACFIIGWSWQEYRPLILDQPIIKNQQGDATGDSTEAPAIPWKLSDKVRNFFLLDEHIARRPLFPVKYNNLRYFHNAITSPIGPRVLPVTTKEVVKGKVVYKDVMTFRYHKGVDFSGFALRDRTNPAYIYAPYFMYKVVDNPYMSRFLCLDLVDRRFVWADFLHMQKNQNRENPNELNTDDVLFPGERLGVMGKFGYAFGYHLHLTLRDASGFLLDPTDVQYNYALLNNDLILGEENVLAVDKRLKEFNFALNIEKLSNQSPTVASDVLRKYQSSYGSFSINHLAEKLQGDYQELEESPYVAVEFENIPALKLKFEKRLREKLKDSLFAIFKTDEAFQEIQNDASGNYLSFQSFLNLPEVKPLSDELLSGLWELKRYSDIDYEAVIDNLSLESLFDNRQLVGLIYSIQSLVKQLNESLCSYIFAVQDVLDANLKPFQYYYESIRSRYQKSEELKAFYENNPQIINHLNIYEKLRGSAQNLTASKIRFSTNRSIYRDIQDIEFHEFIYDCNWYVDRLMEMAHHIESFNIQFSKYQHGNDHPYEDLKRVQFKLFTPSDIQQRLFPYRFFIPEKKTVYGIDNSVPAQPKESIGDRLKRIKEKQKEYERLRNQLESKWNQKISQLRGTVKDSRIQYEEKQKQQELDSLRSRYEEYLD